MKRITLAVTVVALVVGAWSSLGWAADSFIDAIQSAPTVTGTDAPAAAAAGERAAATTSSAAHAQYIRAYNAYVELIRAGDTASRSEVVAAHRAYREAYDNYLASLRTDNTGTGTGGSGGIITGGGSLAPNERDAYVRAYRRYIELKNSPDATEAEVAAALREYVSAYRAYLDALTNVRPETATRTGTGTDTGCPTCTATATSTATLTGTGTATATATATATGTQTLTGTATSTSTATATGTGSLTGTATNTATGTATNTITNTGTGTGNGTGTVPLPTTVEGWKEHILKNYKITAVGSVSKTLPTGTRIEGREWSLEEITVLGKILGDLPASFRAGTKYFQRCNRMFSKDGTERKTTAGLFVTSSDDGIYINQPAYRIDDGTETIVHEMTHAFADNDRVTLNAWKNRFWPNGDKPTSPSPTTYGNSDFEEDMCESTAMYYKRPALMKSEYPDRYAFIKQFIMNGKEF